MKNLISYLQTSDNNSHTLYSLYNIMFLPFGYDNW